MESEWMFSIWRPNIWRCSDFTKVRPQTSKMRIKARMCVFQFILVYYLYSVMLFTMTEVIGLNTACSNARKNTYSFIMYWLLSRHAQYTQNVPQMLHLGWRGKSALWPQCITVPSDVCSPRHRELAGHFHLFLTMCCFMELITCWFCLSKE